MGKPEPMIVPVARDGSHKPDQAAWPIIVVPGIMASRLQVAGGGQKIWDPDDKFFMVGLMLRSEDTRARLFDPTLTPGESIPLPYALHLRHPTFIAHGWGGPAWGFYGDGLVKLNETFLPEGGLVFAFGYDWRQSNRKSGEQLLAFIAKRIQPLFKYKPIIVTHSMGGLVTRAACRSSRGGTPGEKMIAAVIHTFMPSYGTPEAYTKFRLGESDFGLGKIIGRSHEEISVIGSGVAALFQLLPNQVYPSISSAAKKWLTWDSRVENEAESRGKPYSLASPYALYAEKNGRLGLVNHAIMQLDRMLLPNGTVANNTKRRLKRILENIKEARNFHGDLVKDYCHPHTYLVGGKGLDTVISSRLAYPDAEESPATMVNRTMGSGDKTVSLDSAMALSGSGNCSGYAEISGVAHADMFNEDVAIDVVIKFIRAARKQVPEQDKVW
jgi:hypothetical protein